MGRVSFHVFVDNKQVVLTHLFVAPRFDLNVAVSVGLEVLLLVLGAFGATLYTFVTEPARC